MKFRKILSNLKNYVKTKFKQTKTTVDKDLEDLKLLEKQLVKSDYEKDSGKNSIVVSGKTMLRFWLIGLTVVFIGYMTFQSLNVLYLIITALIISIAMEAVIAFFQKFLHRGISIVFAYLLLVVFVLSGFVFVVPFLLGQMSVMLDMFIAWVRNLQNLIQTNSIFDLVNNISWLPDYLKEKMLVSLGNPDIWVAIQQKLQENIAQIIGKGTEYIKDFGNFAVSFLTGFFGFIAKFTVVLTLSVLFSIEKSHVVKFIAYIGGKSKRVFLRIKLEKIYKKLGLWLKGQLLLCVFIGVIMFVALWILSLFGLEIPQKGSLATIAGLMELIPYLGPVLGGVPAVVVVALNNGIYGGLIMIAVIFLIQWLENNVLIPIVMNKTLGVNPVTIFLSILLGGLIMGFVGVLLAIPIAVILTMFFDDKFED